MSMSTQTAVLEHTARRASLDDLLRRIRAEYNEMPGLSLTMAQAQRLWALDASTCKTILERLVESRFLRTTPRGRYVRTEHAVL